MNKRSRSEFSAPARRGAAIGAAYNRKYPYTNYGRAYLRRGTPSNIARFGETRASADSDQLANRMAVGYAGRGKYNMMKASSRWRHSKVGKALGKVAGRAALAAGDHMTGGALSEARDLVGRGTYGRGSYGRGSYGRGSYGRGSYGRGSYTANALFEGGQPRMEVSAGRSDNQEVIISHCEYLQDVYGPPNANFLNQSIDINPGMMENFPWLAQVAANYEEYEFIQLIFEFKSTVDSASSNNSNGATGTIIMATNYNPDAAEFKTKEVMMQYHGANSARLIDNAVHGVECEPSKNAGTATKYIRCANPVGQSLKDFDQGKFQFGIVNIPDAFVNQQVGELWVSYTVRLQKPRLFASVFRNIPYDIYTSNSDTDTTLVRPFGGVDVNTTQKAIPYLNGSDNPSTSTSAMIIQYPPITGVQNSLGVKVGAIVTGTGGVIMSLIFPNFMTGTFNICMSMKYSGPQSTSTSTGIGDQIFKSFQKNGSVEFLTGINGSTDPSTTGGAAQQASDSNSALMNLHVAVAPSTGNSDNIVQFLVDWSEASGAATPTISDLYTSLTITPFNATYLAEQNSSGVITYNPQ